MQEPLRWRLDPGIPDATGAVVHPRLRRALLGPFDPAPAPPPWLMPHQVVAWRRLRAILEVFRGGMLCDGVGLGKTHTALALATTADRVVAVVPASVLHQWRDLSQQLGVRVALVTHEGLSRGQTLPPATLLLVDEAHRFRNPATRRYDRLSRSVGHARVLLITATPVVNTPTDLVRLIQLFLPDHGLALLGVPSLDQVVGPRHPPGFAAAISQLMVSRTRESAGIPTTALPGIHDAPVSHAPPVAARLLSTAIAQIQELTFPTFGADHARDLLRMHLLLRLSSSSPAVLTSLRRHRRFLQCALERGRRGESVTRREVRLLGVPDDVQQLDLLDLLRPASRPLDLDAFEAESDRLDTLYRALRDPPDHSPKLAELQALLTERRSRKTIVFSGAIPTARLIAGALDWTRVALVTGQGARIASGRLAVDEALDLFAPSARGRAGTPPRARIDVLVATDLASEGVNLQDADGVVHYDIPWTPLRLQQRVGRVARLGSRHRIAQTWWFVPPPSLERYLQLERRLAEKSGWQRTHGVPVTSHLGRARVSGLSFERREELASWVPDRGHPCHHAVAAGVDTTVAAIRWTSFEQDTPGPSLRENIVWNHAGEVVEFSHRCTAIARVLTARMRAPAAPVSLAPLRRILKRRLQAATIGPRDPETRRVARQLSRRARIAGSQRRRDRLEQLDEVMRKVADGLPVGGLRALRELLRTPTDWAGLRQWCLHWPTRPVATPTVRVEAVVAGQDAVLTPPAPSRRSSPACEGA